MALPRRWYWSILLLGVVAFLLIDDVFDNPFAIDASIIWSYALVAVLVPIALVANKTLTLGNFLLCELELLLLKYAITTCIAVALWASNDPPPAPPKAEVVTKPAERPQAPPPSPLGPTGAIAGVVLDANDAPVAGAWVYVDSGLDDLAFAVPTTPVTIHNDGRGFSPAFSVLRTYQDLELVVDDAQLHTLAGTNERGEQVFSVPMVAGGRRQPFSTTRELGFVRLSCRVHEDRAEPAHLLVLAHPFATQTDAAGRFVWPDVPARLVTLRAIHGERRTRAAVQVVADERAETRLTVQ
ncbi:MAG: hypothetical protein RMA76_22020 [Deltaproteobacteria bacterium]